MVTWENYEEYMILQADGELGEAEQKALLEFVRLHPELEEEMKLYQATVMKPDTTCVFENKDQLLRQEPGGKIMTLGQWWMYGAAAGVIILILVAATRWFNTGSDTLNNNTEVAKAKEVNPVKNVFDSGSTQVQQVIADKQQHQPAINRPVHRRERSSSVAKQSVHSNTNGFVKEHTLPPTELETMKPIAHKMAVTVTIEKAKSLATPSLTLTDEQPEIIREEGKKDLLAWLPEEKQEGLHTLKENFDQRIEKAKNFKDNLKDAQLALKLGNKELLVINF